MVRWKSFAMPCLFGPDKSHLHWTNTVPVHNERHPFVLEVCVSDRPAELYVPWSNWLGQSRRYWIVLQLCHTRYLWVLRDYTMKGKNLFGHQMIYECFDRSRRVCLYSLHKNSNGVSRRHQENATGLLSSASSGRWRKSSGIVMCLDRSVFITLFSTSWR